MLASVCICAHICVCVYIYVCIYTYMYIYMYTYIYVSKHPGRQHISPGMTKAFLHVLLPVWKRFQMEQKTRLTGNDFSGRNLFTAREGHRMNQFFQMV